MVLRDVADEERTREWMRPLRVLNLPLRSLTKLCKGSRDASPGVLLLLLVLLLLYLPLLQQISDCVLIFLLLLFESVTVLPFSRVELIGVVDQVKKQLVRSVLSNKSQRTLP